MGIILVYDITNISSFRSINKWLNQLDIHASDDVEKMLVGNKIDLGERRAVHFDVGQQLAEEKQVNLILPFRVQYLLNLATFSVEIFEYFFDLLSL